MIPLLPATCPPPQRFARYRRGEHLRRELLPGPAIVLPVAVQPLALPAPTQAVAPESLFSYDNVNWRRVAPAPRRNALLAVENLMDQLAQYLYPIFDTQAEAGATPLGKGLPAGPGAAAGKIPLSDRHRGAPGRGSFRQRLGKHLLIQRGRSGIAGGRKPGQAARRN
jgi:hypothetical protein